MDLRVSLAPHWHDLALVQPETDSAVWERAASPAITLRADLVHRGTPSLQPVIDLD